MKKFFYSGIFAIALIVSANANAAVNNNTLNYNEGDSSNINQMQEEIRCDNLLDPSSSSSCNNFTLRDDLEDIDVVVDDGDDDGGDTGTTTTTKTATVSSCPTGTTKSSDGCCCVNN